MANQRTKKVFSSTLNGIDAGGSVSALIEWGYDQSVESVMDGLAMPIRDRQVEFVRGTLVHEDWVHLLELLTAAPGSYVFYERKSGADIATGFIRHTLSSPIVHRSQIQIRSGNAMEYIRNSIQFECKPAQPTDGFLQLWTQTDDHAGPGTSNMPAARGGIRILSTVFKAASPIPILHVTGFTLNVVQPLTRASNDDWVGYDVVECEEDGLRITGSITFQDASIATNLLAQRLVAAGRDQLTLTVRQGSGATAKTIAIEGVEFDPEGFNAGIEQPFNETTLGFTVTNSTSSNLTLNGTSKAIVVADAT